MTSCHNHRRQYLLWLVKVVVPTLGPVFEVWSTQASGTTGLISITLDDLQALTRHEASKQRNPFGLELFIHGLR